MLSQNIRWLRYLIEFSSILVLAFLWPILTDVTLAKQFNIGMCA